MSVPNGIVWENFVTAQGKEFSLGRPAPESKPDGTSASVPEPQALTAGGPVALASGPSFNIAVNWPVAHAGAWDEWKATGDDVRGTARITRYNLYKYGTPSDNWNYMLQFTNEDTYHYYFTDQEGDTYSVNTFRNGDHYLRYNSNAPNIVRVSGN